MKSENPPLTVNQVESLVKFLELTREQELTCSECLANIGEFAETKLAGRPFAPLLTQVEHHLELCPECREEWLALLQILQSEI